MTVWSTIKNLFASEGWGGFINQEGTRDMTGFIRPTQDGGAKLIDSNGNVVSVYVRARDARRGAARRGFVVA